VKGNGTVDGSDAEQWDYLGGADQKWIVTSVGNGQYTIVCSASNKPLELDPAVSSAPPAQINIANNTTAQRWTFTSAADGYSITNVSRNLVLDVSGRSVTNGGLIVGWSNTGGTNQKWTLQAP
jgi:Flp pilus assembly protein TadG